MNKLMKYLLLSVAILFGSANAATNIGVVGTSGLGTNWIANIVATGDIDGTVVYMDALTYNATSPADLRVSYDVLLFPCCANISIDVDWNTRLLPYLALGGGILWENPFQPSLNQLFAVTSAFGPTGGSPILITATVPGLTDGITNSFVNNHIRFNSWDPALSAFIGNGLSETYGLYGEFGAGRIVLSGPDNNWHHLTNQRQLVLNTVLWLTDGASNDSDADGVLDASDNCPDTANSEQVDTDGDGIGDVCDDDNDNDGILDESDNCQFTANPDQIDTDSDGIGDACVDDDDGDGINDNVDICPVNPDPLQEDTDSDGIGDACDNDDDNDGILDDLDNCPIDINSAQEDLDNDGLGDVCDADDDGDGTNDVDDNCPIIPNPTQENSDSDDAGNACDPDDDNDLVLDNIDNCPLIANADQANSDGQGAGDACNEEFDMDGDNYEDDYDNCPSVSNSSQNDYDGDSIGDACDDDIDGDNVVNNTDICVQTTLGSIVDPGTGCSIIQLCPASSPRGSSTPWRNHGKYVSCTAKSAEKFVELGLITEAEKDEIVSTAAQSDIGKK